MGLLEAIFSVVGEVKEAVNSIKLQETEEFKSEVKELEKELADKSDFDLLVEFHSAYAEDKGCGLIPKQNYFGSDPQYHAYRNVFQERRICRYSAFCPRCEREDLDITVGFRYFFIHPEYIQNEDEERWYLLNHRNLTKGTCYCPRCGSFLHWEIDDSELTVR